MRIRIETLILRSLSRRRLKASVESQWTRVNISSEHSIVPPSLCLTSKIIWDKVKLPHMPRVSRWLMRGARAEGGCQCYLISVQNERQLALPYMHTININYAKCPPWVPQGFKWRLSSICIFISMLGHTAHGCCCTVDYMLGHTTSSCCKHCMISTSRRVFNFPRNY